MTRTDDQITLFNIQFNLNACKKLSKNELDALSDTASNFFHFIQDFGSKLKLRNFVNVWMVEGRVQNLDSMTFGIFQLYFYDNLFNPNENCNVQEKCRLNKWTLKTLLNDVCVLDDRDKNEDKTPFKMVLQ